MIHKCIVLLLLTSTAVLLLFTAWDGHLLEEVVHGVEAGIRCRLFASELQLRPVPGVPQRLIHRGGVSTGLQQRMRVVVLLAARVPLLWQTPITVSCQVNVLQNGCVILVIKIIS